MATQILFFISNLQVISSSFVVVARALYVDFVFFAVVIAPFHLILILYTHIQHTIEIKTN